MVTKWIPMSICSILLASFALLGSTDSGFAASSKKPAIQTAKVTVTATGYEPAHINLKKGIPAAITFKRITDKGCGDKLVLPDYKITKDLPLNKAVTVKFTPTKTGRQKFTCGMGMYKGTIVVK